MNMKTGRFCLFIAGCSIAGVILGGTASQAEIRQCLTAELPTHECLTQNPVHETIEGMSFGLIAGLGAALGATWQMWQKDLL